MSIPAPKRPMAIVSDDSDPLEDDELRFEDDDVRFVEFDLEAYAGQQTIPKPPA